MCWFYFNRKIYVVLHGLVNKKLLTAYFMWLINKKINNNKINKLHYSMVSSQQLPPYNGRGLIGFQFGFFNNMLNMHHIWQLVLASKQYSYLPQVSINFTAEKRTLINVKVGNVKITDLIHVHVLQKFKDKEKIILVIAAIL